MIETPQSSIRPEQELARLTLETESVKEKMRRRSTLKSDRPSFGQIDHMPMIGPLSMAEYEKTLNADQAVLQSPAEAEAIWDPLASPSTEKKDAEENTINDSQGVDDTTVNDNSSEATLVSKPDSDQVLPDQTNNQDQPLLSDDKENFAPDKVDTTITPNSFQTVEPLAPASPSKLNSQAGWTAHTAAASRAIDVDPELMKYQPPSGKPPPVPPRKPVLNSTMTLEEYARQQDVTEVMNHCIIQLSCAMRPTGSDKSGEQLDEVHDLFFGQQIVHCRPEKEATFPVPFLNIITRVYHQPSDVYAAIDNEYDLQDAQDGTKAYTSVIRLPPVLSIALDRVSWNQEAKRQEKLNHHVEVPETIYMDRYLESTAESELMQRREQTWEVKKELALLSARRSILEEKHV